MKILCLYANPCAEPLFDWLQQQGHELVRVTDRLEPAWCAAQQFDLAISYTYRYILKAEHLRALGGNVINLHNSYLPFNRGADPNLWSILEDTPRGVTIHYMDEQLDKGTIIAQQLVPLLPQDTLRSSYNRLDEAAKQLFREIWPLYPHWRQMAKTAVGRGTYHSVKDGEAMHACIESYDMSAEAFRTKYLQSQQK